MKPVWEDLVDDFLEVTARLTPAQRECALEKLRETPVRKTHISVHPAFSIDGKMVVIIRGEAIRECFHYFVAENRVVRMPAGRNAAHELVSHDT